MARKAGWLMSGWLDDARCGLAGGPRAMRMLRAAFGVSSRRKRGSFNSENRVRRVRPHSLRLGERKKMDWKLKASWRKTERERKSRRRRKGSDWGRASSEMIGRKKSKVESAEARTRSGRRSSLDVFLFRLALIQA